MFMYVGVTTYGPPTGLRTLLTCCCLLVTLFATASVEAAPPAAGPPGFSEDVDAADPAPPGRRSLRFGHRPGPLGKQGSPQPARRSTAPPVTMARQPAATTAAAPPLPDDAHVNVDLQGADLRSILKLLAELTGTLYLYDDDFRGKANLIGPTRVPLRQAVILLKSIIEHAGFTFVDTGSVTKVVQRQKAHTQAIETNTSFPPPADVDAAEPAERLVTQFIPVRHTGVADLKASLAAFVATPGTLVAHEPTNSLIVTDSRANIDRLVAIATALDQPVRGRGIHTYPARHISAAALADAVGKVLEHQAAEKLEPPTRQTVAAKPAVIADPRTNVVVVICMDEDLAAIRALLASFDVSARYVPSTRLIAIEPAAVNDVAAALRQLLVAGNDALAKELTITTDVRTNSVVCASTSPPLLAECERLAATLDQPVDTDAARLVQVHRLQFAEAETMAGLLEGFDFVPPEELQQAARPTGTAGAPPGKAAKDVRIQPDKATNSLVIVCPRHRWPYIRDVITQLDVVRPQVLIEALILEIDVSRARELGLDFNLLDTASSDDHRPFGLGSTGIFGDIVANGRFSGGLNVGILSDRNFDLSAAAGGDWEELTKIGVIMRAIRTDGRANVLSAPQIVTSDNETAKISVGEQIQLPTSFATAANTGVSSIASFATEDLGVILEVTPRITRNDRVVLKLSQMIKSRTSDTLFDQNIPVIAKRDLESNVVVADGETVVLGGLVSDTETITETGIPILEKIPGLGRLFRDRRRDHRKTNLLVFLTPHILRDRAAARATTERARDSVDRLLHPRVRRQAHAMLAPLDERLARRRRIEDRLSAMRRDLGEE